MAVKYLAGDRLQGTAAERAALTTVSAPAQTSWKVVARGKVTGGTSTNVDGVDTGEGNSSSNNNVITVNTLYSNPPDNIMFLFHGVKPDTNSRDPMVNFGYNTIEFDNTFARYRNTHNDTNSAWGSVEEDNGLKGLPVHNEVGDHGMWWGFISNMESQPKNFNSNGVASHDGASNGLVATSISGQTMSSGTWYGGGGSGNQWTNKLNRITFHRKALAGGTNYYWGEDTEFVILGCDNNEGDNNTRGETFWNLIGETEITTAGQLSASFTAKKWLMFEAFITPSSSSSHGIFFNDDDSAKYVHRTSRDRIRYDDNSYFRDNKNAIYLNTPGMGQTVWIKGMIDNRSGAAKLVTLEATSMDNHGSTEPNHVYTAGKYASTSQITKINVGADDGTDIDYAVGSWLRVWGND